MDNTRKVGRPSIDKPYRKNVVRVGAIEDWILELIERVPQRSEAKKILENELSRFRMKESQKVIKRSLRSAK